MGNSCTTRSTVAKISDLDHQEDSSAEDNAMYFLCTRKGIILENNEQVEVELLYSKADLRDKFIGMILSPFISYLLKKVFINFLTSTGLKQSRLLLNLKDSSGGKRPFIAYDLQGLPVYVSLHMVLHTAAEMSILYTELNMNSNFDFSSLKKNEKYVMFQINRIRTKNSVANLNTVVNVNLAMTYNPDILTSKAVNEVMSHSFKTTANDVVVICIDSIQMSMEKGPHHMAHISAQFYKDIINLTKNHFYPFIYIYEIIGRPGCFMFIVDADWTYNLSPFCATISVYFIKNLIKQVRKYISIRAGFSYGRISYGLIGDNIRFFGDTINLSVRLEYECGKNEFLVSEPFYEKLNSELVSLEVNESFIMPDKKVIYRGGSFSGTQIDDEPEEEETNHTFDIDTDVQRQTKSFKGIPNDKPLVCYRVLPESISNMLSFFDT